jgi:hypothetical protein
MRLRLPPGIRSSSRTAPLDAAPPGLDFGERAGILDDSLGGE